MRYMLESEVSSNVVLSARVSASPNHVACEIAGETVILSLPRGMYYGLDAVGTSVWRMLAEPTTVAAMRDELLREFEVDADRCERDLVRLLGELAEHGLVVVDDSAHR